MDQIFPIVKLKGRPEDLGLRQGTLLRERIHRTVDFYRKQFLQPEDRILDIAGGFRKATEAFRRDLYLEVESMARAADVDPLWIYALNGRTELLNLNPNECTSLAFKQQRLIGQNWDWDSEVEELALVLDIEKEGSPRIITMTEPGMIGKIGMNDSGLGVCLNFMSIDDYQPYGAPLHILLRTILECRSVNEAISRIKPYLPGKVGNILIADRSGAIEDIELAGDKFHSARVDDLFVHTNHFLSDVEYDPRFFPNTLGRYKRAKELLSMIRQPSVDAMKDVLKDRSDEENPICRKRFSHPLLTDDTSITVTTTLMDLTNLQFHITRGNPFDHPFTIFTLK